MTPEQMLAAQVAAVVGLVQVAKQAGLPTRYAAASAVVAGVLIFGGGAVLTGAALVVYQSVLLGLTGTGVYALITGIGGETTVVANTTGPSHVHVEE